MKMTERSQRSRATFLGVLGVAVAAALVLPTSAVGQTTTEVTSVSGSAYAIQATGTVPIPREAEINAPPCPKSAAVPTVADVGNLISAGVLRTGAQCSDPATLPSAAGFIRMTADVANATVLPATVPGAVPVLEVGGVHVECVADADEVDGFTSIATLAANGDSSTNLGRFDTTTDLSGLVSTLFPGARLIINEETPNTADRNTVTINGVHLFLPARVAAPGVPETPAVDLIIGHVECTRTVRQVSETTTTTAGATTTTNGGATTTTGNVTTTTAGGGTTTTAGGGTTTTAGAGPTTTAGAGPTTTRTPTGTLARTGAMLPPWLLVAAVALVLGGMMRFGSPGGDRLASAGAAAPTVEGMFRPVRPERRDAERRACGPLDAVAADALNEMERSSPASAPAPQAPIEAKPSATRAIGELIARRRRW